MQGHCILFPCNSTLCCFLASEHINGKQAERLLLRRFTILPDDLAIGVRMGALAAQLPSLQSCRLVTCQPLNAQLPWTYS